MGGSRWSVEVIDGVRLARCEALAEVPGVAHAFSTRVEDGGLAFDLGPAEGESGEVQERRRRFLQAAGLGGRPLPILRQVHGGELVDARNAQGARADGAIGWTEPGDTGPVAAVRTADCVALLAADRQGRVVAAVHAGWRGVAARIPSRMVAWIQQRGVHPSDLVVALGPAIRGCCYEVGREVVEALEAASGRGRIGLRRNAGRTTVDLHVASQSQLVEAGVDPGQIHGAPWCTGCRTDLFFSSRTEGPAAGRLMAVVGRTGCA